MFIWFPDKSAFGSFFQIILQPQYFLSSLSSVDERLHRSSSIPRTPARDDGTVRWCLIYGLIRVAQLGLGNADQRPQRSIHRSFVREILGNIRGEEDQIRSLLEPLRILASDTTPEFREVVFRPQIVGQFSVIRLLYNTNVFAYILA